MRDDVAILRLSASSYARQARRNVEIDAARKAMRHMGFRDVENFLEASAARARERVMRMSLLSLDRAESNVVARAYTLP